MSGRVHYKRIDNILIPLSDILLRGFLGFKLNRKKERVR